MVGARGLNCWGRGLPLRCKGMRCRLPSAASTRDNPSVALVAHVGALAAQGQPRASTDQQLCLQRAQPRPRFAGAGRAAAGVGAARAALRGDAGAATAGEPGRAGVAAGAAVADVCLQVIATIRKATTQRKSGCTDARPCRARLSTKRAVVAAEATVEIIVQEVVAIRAAVRESARTDAGPCRAAHPKLAGLSASAAVCAVVARVDTRSTAQREHRRANTNPRRAALTSRAGAPTAAAVQSIAQRIDTRSVAQRKHRGARPRVDDRGLWSDVSHIGDVAVGRVLLHGYVARIACVRAGLLHRIQRIEDRALIGEHIDRGFGGHVGPSRVAAEGRVEARIDRGSIRVGDVFHRAGVAQCAGREVDLGEAPCRPQRQHHCEQSKAYRWVHDSSSVSRRPHPTEDALAGSSLRTSSRRPAVRDTRCA